MRLHRIPNSSDLGTVQRESSDDAVSHHDIQREAHALAQLTDINLIGSHGQFCRQLVHTQSTLRSYTNALEIAFTPMSIVA